MAESYIHNALLRCTRPDRVAEPSFDLARDDLGLWVLELSEYEQADTIEDEVDAIYQRLIVHKDIFPKLISGSSDYTLHITFVGEESSRLFLPPKLMLLAAQSNFRIEVYRYNF